MPENMGNVRLDKIIGDALNNYDKVTEEDIYRNLGVAIISMGLEPETDSKSSYFLKPLGNMNVKYAPFTSMSFLIDTLSSEIGADTATKTAKVFWEVFKEKATKYICGDEGIMKLVEEAKLREALAVVVPPLLVAMGLSQVFIPVVAIIAVGLLMLLLKAGIDAFCDWQGASN